MLYTKAIPMKLCFRPDLAVGAFIRPRDPYILSTHHVYIENPQSQPKRQHQLIGVRREIRMFDKQLKLLGIHVKGIQEDLPEPELRIH